MKSKVQSPTRKGKIMAIKRFEDIEAWQAARGLTREIYKSTHLEPFAHDYGLCNQIQRASVSIMANISEGFDSNSDDEFVRFLRYALRSATEVQSHLYVAVDQGYISKDEFTQLYDQAIEVKSLIAGFTPWNNV